MTAPVDGPALGRGDRRLLRRASAVVALQSAVVVAVVVGIMVGGVLVVDRHERGVRIEQATEDVWRGADDVNDPPSGTWLVAVSESGERQTTPEAPGWLESVDPSSLPNGRSRVDVGEHVAVVWTGTRRSGQRLTAVYDVHALDEQTERLRTAMLTAAALGVLGAAAAGGLIGRWAVRPLGRALALQRRFVADASHELRTPLTVLTTRAQLLRRRLVDEGVAAEADQLVRDARVMGDVVNDLLLSAELRQEPQRGTWVDVREVAQDVVESLRPLAQERGVELTYVGDVGDVGAGVRGAPSALRRAVSSLVDNAIAHTAPGGHVRLEVGTGRELTRVAVEDDGEGLDPAEARAMVRRFARGTTNDSGRRFGLGLALVEEIALAHGGRLQIDGARGVGATFELVLPTVRAPLPADSQDEG